jgi:Family of unknown function (DUF6544)
VEATDAGARPSAHAASTFSERKERTVSERDVPINRLPTRVRGYVQHTTAADGSVPRQVRIAQEGCMWQKPGARAMRFTAVERFAVDRVAFSWHARFPIVGPLAVDVVDEYDAGAGKLDVRFLGLRVRRQRGRETAVGEALRYLAELPWAPHAMACNPELQWHERDERSVDVATAFGDTQLVVRMTLDADGDIARTSSEMRPLELDGEWCPTPWGGEFHDYETIGGVRIPTRAEVYWELDEGRFTYWQGRITAVELLAEPFSP